MNKKGFTLIEMLITIAILAVLSLIAIPTVNSLIKRQQDNAIKEIIESVETSALNYVKENKWDLTWIKCSNTTDTDSEDITIKELVETDYLSQIPKNPKDQKEFDLENNNYYVKVTYNCQSKTFTVDSSNLEEELTNK